MMDARSLKLKSTLREFLPLLGVCGVYSLVRCTAAGDGAQIAFANASTVIRT